MCGVRRLLIAVLSGVLVLAVMTGLYALSYKADLRWDATLNKRYSLSPESARLMEKLDRDVRALAFYRPGEELRRIRDLLDLYARASDKFTYEVLDLDLAPQRARELGVTGEGEVVLVCGDKREKTVFPGEHDLTNAVARVAGDRDYTVYLATGHGEIGPAARGEDSVELLVNYISDQGTRVRELSLWEAESVPDDAAALLILGPKADFFDPELDMLTGYVRQGGRLLIAFDNRAGTNLAEWAEENLFLRMIPGMVYDVQGRANVGNPFFAMAAPPGNVHEITEGFVLPVVMPTAGALEILDRGPGGPTPVMLTSVKAWLETGDADVQQPGFDEKQDKRGPLTLAAAFEAEREKNDSELDDSSKTGQQAPSPSLRAVVFADQDFLTDKYVQSYGNPDLAINSVNWLLQRPELIAVSKPDPVRTFLFLEGRSRRVLIAAPSFLVPGLVFLFGILVAVKRRKA